MAKIYFVYHDRFFLEFIESFLKRKGFEIFASVDGAGVVSDITRLCPDIVIFSKNIKNIDIEGFLIRKKLMAQLKFTKIFLIGNYTQEEKKLYKKYEINDFIQTPLKLSLLMEHLGQYLTINNNENSKSTPMLSDLYAKKNVL